MRFTTPLIVITCFGLTAAMKAEDKNLAAFTKAFPDAKVLDGSPEEATQRYTVSAKISVEDLALRLGKTLGAKISVLSAKDPKIFPEAETLKGKDTAILLMGELAPEVRPRRG